MSPIETLGWLLAVLLVGGMAVGFVAAVGRDALRGRRPMAVPRSRQVLCDPEMPGEWPASETNLAGREA